MRHLLSVDKNVPIHMLEILHCGNQEKMAMGESRVSNTSKDTVPFVEGSWPLGNAGANRLNETKEEVLRNLESISFRYLK